MNMLVGCAFDDLELGANVATVALAVVSIVTYYLCWRWSETSRLRRMAKGRLLGSSTLPSPIPLLPRWIPFIGGHTLQMKRREVGRYVLNRVHGYARASGSLTPCARFALVYYVCGIVRLPRRTCLSECWAWRPASVQTTDRPSPKAKMS